MRLVVGTINLVEKIAQLANVPMDEVKKLGEGRVSGLRREVAAQSDGPRRQCGGAMAPASAARAEEKEIIKEGLSEYFIYTIEGTETIPNGWSKRMRSFEGNDVPFKIQYRYRPQEYGDQLVRMYLLTNDKESKLGTTPLPDGVVRVFRDNGRDGLSYLTQQTDQVHPDRRQDRTESRPRSRSDLRAGQAASLARQHLDADQRHERVPSKSATTAIEIEVNSTVVGWDDHSLFRQRIRNYTASRSTWKSAAASPATSSSAASSNRRCTITRRSQFTTQVAPGAKKDLLYEIVQHQGRNAKQNNVTLEAAAVTP